MCGANKKSFWRNIPDQIIRLAVVTVLLVGGAGAIYILLPASLTSTKLHRELTVTAETEKPIRFAGSTLCGDCHQIEYEKKIVGYHKSLSCETCHGAAAAHVDDPMAATPFVPREREVCPVCHEYDPSRPTGFPQINPTIHNPLQSCANCHNPHDPVPPTTPQECSACHAGIMRTKSVSSHALIACTTCHKVPEQHKIFPRIVRATKPESRDFCGTCHSQGSSERSAPKIDLSRHEERYVCWQCHYPHLPAERL